MLLNGERRRTGAGGGGKRLRFLPTWIKWEILLGWSGTVAQHMAVKKRELMKGKAHGQKNL